MGVVGGGGGGGGEVVVGVDDGALLSTGGGTGPEHCCPFGQHPTTPLLPITQFSEG